jgi:hypothetical protein
MANECGSRRGELGNMQGRVDESDPHGRMQEDIAEKV